VADGDRTPIVGGIIGWAVPEVLRNVDTDALLDSIDIDAVVAELDVNAIADRLDLDELVERMDVDAIADRLDINALVERIDVNAVAQQLDLDALMERIDLTAVMGRGTQEVAEGSLDFVRRQLVRFDALVVTVFARVLRRDRSAFPEGPAALTEAEEIDTGRPVDRKLVSGHYAGVVSRGTGLVVDWFGALASFGLLGAALSFVIAAAFNVEFTLTTEGWVGQVTLVLWLLLWYWAPLVVTGRTPAMFLVGLRVVRRSGAPVGGGRALVRTIVLPISSLILLISYLGVVFGRERRALEDVASGTVVVYDWGRREAEQPASLLARAGQMIRDNRDPVADA